MKFITTPIEGVIIVEPEPMGDERGLFARIFCQKEFAEAGITKDFVQSNLSRTAQKGSVRGMHSQKAPSTEAKLVQCVQGAVFDVAVDVREESPTYLQWFGVELSRDNMRRLYIPERCAHGFQTLTDDVEMHYQHSEFYAPNTEYCLRYNDPALGVEWPLPVAVVSEKDQNHPLINH